MRAAPRVTKDQGFLEFLSMMGYPPKVVMLAAWELYEPASRRDSAPVARDHRLAENHLARFLKR